MKGFLRRDISVLMVAIYVVFYVSANFFYHSHVYANSKVVHSHPFGSKTHNHTADQIQLIQVVESSSYESSTPMAEVPAGIEGIQSTIVSIYGEQTAQIGAVAYPSLRAPPVSFCMSL